LTSSLEEEELDFIVHLMNYSLIKLKYVKVAAIYWCLIKTEIAIHTTKLVYGKISNHDNQNALRLMATADHT